MLIGFFSNIAGKRIAETYTNRQQKYYEKNFIRNYSIIYYYFNGRDGICFCCGRC